MHKISVRNVSIQGYRILVGKPRWTIGLGSLVKEKRKIYKKKEYYRIMLKT
jgi:hypothetical protein